MATITLDTDRHTVTVVGTTFSIDPNEIDTHIAAYDLAGKRSFDKHGIIIWTVSFEGVEVALSVERAKLERMRG